MPELTPHQASNKEAWSLDQWLIYLNEVHPSNIELGLERVSAVYQHLYLGFTDKQVVTVAGTNGKGTTCALIEQGLLISGKTVGVYSSPHLIDYRERVRVQGGMLSVQAHCDAFLKVEHARKDIPLTYFEFGALAAFQLLADANVDYLLLEIGLGGRLDAVNIIDPDVAVITGIDLDHQDWLGDTKEQIAKEKAGIFRKNIPAIIGDPAPPKSLETAAEYYQVKAKWQAKDFIYGVNQNGFYWRSATQEYSALPIPNIPLQNASTALQVLEVLMLKLSQEQMSHVFKSTTLPGRRQIIQTQPTVMLDVAHNPQAVTLLARDLKSKGYKRIIAVVAMLADKDIVETLKPMLEQVNQWHCASLQVPRGATASQLVCELSFAKKVLDFGTVEQAYIAALNKAGTEDCIIVFGSFFTVAEILNLKVFNESAKE